MRVRRLLLILASGLVVLTAVLFQSVGAWHRSPTTTDLGRATPSLPTFVATHGRQLPEPARREVLIDDTPLDLSGIVERTHFAFQSVQGGYVGGDATYKVTVNGRSFQFEPERPASNTRAKLSGTPVVFTTLQVSTDDHDLASTSATFERTREGSLEASYGPDVVERLRNTKSGLEQDWVFATRPAGDGDLRVAVEARGQAFVTANRSGIHLADAGTGLGVVYSHARWIDATGTTTEVPVEYLAGRLVMRVPGAVLDSSTYPAILDPTVSAEFGVDNPIDSVASLDQWTPAIGHASIINAEFLVVWRDSRRSVTGFNSDIFGAHVTRNGTVLEPEGFIISDSGQGGDHANPVVQWDGSTSQYIVVFRKTLSGAQDIVAVTIPGALGQVPSATITLTASSYVHSDYPAITINRQLNGTIFAVAWQDDNGIELTRCEMVGSILNQTAAPSLVRMNGAGHQYALPRISGSDPSVGFGTNILLVSEDRKSFSATNDIVGNLIDTNFAVTSSFPIFLGAPNHAANSPDVAFFGSTGTWVVVYDYDAGGFGTNYDIKATEVSVSGSVGTPINVAIGSQSQVNPSVTGYGSSGAHAFATWVEGASSSGPFQIKGVRLTSPMSIALPVVTFGGDAVGGRAPVHSDEVSRYFLVWADQRDKVDSFTRQYDVYGSRVDWNGTRLDGLGGFLITKAINSEVMPAISFCNSNYLVAWSDSRNGYYNRDLYASLVSSSGTIITSPIVIANGAGAQDSPAIACNGTNFYVVWVDERNGNRDVYGSMIDGTTGAVLNPGGVAIVTTLSREDHPAIAFGGGNFMVVLDHANALIVYASVSGATGALLSGPTVIAGRESRTHPDIAYDGTKYWVVWQTNMTANLDITGASLTPSGTVGPITTLENQAADQRYPKVAWDSGKGLFTVVFEDDRNFGSSGTDIYARSFTTTGVLVSPAFAVAGRAETELGPHIIARDLGLHEVVYSRTNDVFGRPIGYGGVSGPEYAVSAAATIREGTPAIACSSATSCMVPYRWLDEQSVTNPIDRIKARLVSYP